jgi:hypothetical protein
MLLISSELLPRFGRCSSLSTAVTEEAETTRKTREAGEDVKNSTEHLLCIDKYTHNAF